jgi:hypothetical protein
MYCQMQCAVALVLRFNFVLIKAVFINDFKRLYFLKLLIRNFVCSTNWGCSKCFADGVDWFQFERRNQ